MRLSIQPLPPGRFDRLYYRAIRVLGAVGLVTCGYRCTEAVFARDWFDAVAYAASIVLCFFIAAVADWCLWLRKELDQ